jgi:hypothetical protein
VSPPADAPSQRRAGGGRSRDERQPRDGGGEPQSRWLKTPLGWAMVALMAVGSIVMWIGIPLGLIYLASQVAESSRPSLGPYLIVFLGLPICMGLMGKLLSMLDRRYAAMQGIDRRYRPGWTKSMRGERGSSHKWTVLDTVMLWSVIAALVASAIWFFGFAGSPLPSV